MTQEKTQNRQAMFITPDNLMKGKVGDGGLSEDVLKRAQSLLDSNMTDFKPFAENFLASIAETVQHAEGIADLHDLPAEQNEVLLNTILYPALELKSHSAMFKYPMIGRMAGDLVHFLEHVKGLNAETLDIVKAYQKTMSLVAIGAIPREETKDGENLCAELNQACLRYFEKYNKENAAASND